jgi:hypothetical protein
MPTAPTRSTLTSLQAAVLCATLGVAMLHGCVAPRQAQPVAAPPGDAEAGIPYAELAAAFNARVALLDRLWSRTRVEVRWVDAEGKPRFDAGEGYLIYALPSRVALSVGKMGQTGLWAGADEQRYWLLDVQADPSQAWFGRHNRLGAVPPADFPLAVAPHDLPRLLGVTPLPTQPPIEPVVVHEQGIYTLLLAGQRTRLTLDAVTLMPLSVALLDDAGRVLIQSQLSSPQPVRIRGLGSADWPLISGRARVTVPGGAAGAAGKDTTTDDASMTLELVGDVLGGDARGRINPRLFDFEYLVTRQFRVPADQRVDLDVTSAGTLP